MAEPTIRQQIMNALLAKLTGLRKHDAPAEAVFNYTGRFELGDLNYDQLPAVTLYEGEESTDAAVNNWINKTLRVFIEFSFTNDMNVDVYEQYNYYLGELLYGLLQEPRLGTPPRYLNYDIREVGNSPRIVDRNDEMPGGVLILDIDYRIGNYNPYSNNPNT